VTDPSGPATGSRRVLRGGGWGLDARFCRSASRATDEPRGRGIYLGMRVARVVAE